MKRSELTHKWQRVLIPAEIRDTGHMYEVHLRGTAPGEGEYYPGVYPDHPHIDCAAFQLFIPVKKFPTRKQIEAAMSTVEGHSGHKGTRDKE